MGSSTSAMYIFVVICAALSDFLLQQPTSWVLSVAASVAGDNAAAANPHGNTTYNRESAL